MGWSSSALRSTPVKFNLTNQLKNSGILYWLWNEFALLIQQNNHSFHPLLWRRSFLPPSMDSILSLAAQPWAAWCAACSLLSPSAANFISFSVAVGEENGATCAWRPTHQSLSFLSINSPFDSWIDEEMRDCGPIIQQPTYVNKSKTIQQFHSFDLLTCPNAV